MIAFLLFPREAAALESAYSPQTRLDCAVTQTQSLPNSKSTTPERNSEFVSNRAIQNPLPNGYWILDTKMLLQKSPAEDTIHPCCTVRAKVRVKWREDRKELHQLHIQQTTVYLLINHGRAGKKEDKSPETHYTGYTTVGQSMSL